MHLYGAGGKMRFEDLNKTRSWKSQIKHTVKYDAYLDILLMVSIHVARYLFFNEDNEIYKSGFDFQPML